MADEAPLARPATAADRQQLVEVLADAFADDPAFVYMLPPDLRRREARLRGFFHLEVPRSERLGGVWKTADGAGAAIWYPPDQWRPSTWEALRQTPAALRVFGRQLSLASSALTTMWAHHPRQPHWYLYYLAAVPSRQSTGIGSALCAQSCNTATRRGPRPIWKRPASATGRCTGGTASRTGTSTSSRTARPCIPCGVSRGHTPRTRNRTDRALPAAGFGDFTPAQPRVSSGVGSVRAQLNQLAKAAR